MLERVDTIRNTPGLVEKVRSLVAASIPEAPIPELTVEILKKFRSALEGVSGKRSGDPARIITALKVFNPQDKDSGSLIEGLQAAFETSRVSAEDIDLTRIDVNRLAVVMLNIILGSCEQALRLTVSGDSKEDRQRAKELAGNLSRLVFLMAPSDYSFDDKPSFLDANKPERQIVKLVLQTLGADFFKGKRVVEIGPGPVPSDALFMLREGARSALLVDVSEKTIFNLESILTTKGFFNQEGCKQIVRGIIARIFEKKGLSGVIRLPAPTDRSYFLERAREEGKKFHLVYAVSTYHYVDDEQFLKDLTNSLALLAPGGAFAISLKAHGEGKYSKGGILLDRRMGMSLEGEEIEVSRFSLSQDGQTRAFRQRGVVESLINRAIGNV